MQETDFSLAEEEDISNIIDVMKEIFERHKIISNRSNHKKNYTELNDLPNNNSCYFVAVFISKENDDFMFLSKENLNDFSDTCLDVLNKNKKFMLFDMFCDYEKIYDPPGNFFKNMEKGGKANTYFTAISGCIEVIKTQKNKNIQND